MSWGALLGLAAAAYALKALGPVLLGRRRLPADAVAVLEMIEHPAAGCARGRADVRGSAAASCSTLVLPPSRWPQCWCGGVRRSWSWCSRPRPPPR